MLDENVRAAMQQTIAEASPELRPEMERLAREVEEKDRRRDALPCLKETPRDCAERSTCEFRLLSNVCPLRLRRTREEDVSRRLVAARVPQDERTRIVAHWRETKRLKNSPAIVAVNAWLKGDAWQVQSERAKGEIRRGARIMMLAGSVGVGKTLAACYALARRGGLYLPAYQCARINEALLTQAAETRGVLVIDQLDFDGAGVPPFAAQQVRELLHTRYAELRRTLLCANMPREAFAATFSATMADRLGGWVELQGKSQRAEEVQA